VGKWHQDRESFHRSFCGADRIFGFTPGWYVQYGGHWNVAVHDFDPTGCYPSDTGYLLHADKQTKMPPIPGLGGVHSSEMFSDAAIEFLEQHAGDESRQPFFLYLAYVAPHDPRQSPEDYEKRYDACNLPLPPNYLERHPFDNGELTVRDEFLEAWPRRPHAIRRHLADYYACIEHLDAQIGRVLQTLKQTGMEDDTLIVFASDNGLGIGSHGLMGKQNLYEHSVRVPLIFSGPGIPAAQQRDDFCYLHDVFPTLCDLVDCQPPRSVEGLSLIGPLVYGSPGSRKHLYHAYRGVQRAIRDGHYKLIEYVTGTHRQTQLFDLAADPDEQENLASEPDLAAVVRELRAQMMTLRQQCGDNRELENVNQRGSGINY
jgi:arylsulfatase A-like enzyme